MQTIRIGQLAKSALLAAVLALSLCEVLARFAILRLRHGKNLTYTQRAQWLHSACKTIVRRLRMKVASSGISPTAGLVVSNHLSYLDILFYASLMPCIFVSKSEVISWPMFGILARCGGTIFVERNRTHGVNTPAGKIAEALSAGVPVILFPEGTSTDGSVVLPFLSALFEPAIATQAPVLTAAIRYSLADGVEADLCYYGDITFAPHLLKALSRRQIVAGIAFDNEANVYDDRKVAARAAWQDVVSLRQAGS